MSEQELVIGGTPISDAGDLAGEHVVIFGLEGKIKPVGKDDLADPEAEAVEANGAHGRILGYAFMEDMYVMEASDGVRFAVQAQNLQPFNTSIENGGFDLRWQKDVRSLGDVESDIAQCLVNKGFCVVEVQSSTPSEPVIDAMQAEIQGIEQPPRQFYAEEEEYVLGSRNSTICFELEVDDVESMPGSVVTSLDRDLSNLSLMLAGPLSSSCDLDIWGRTNSLLRVKKTEEALSIRPHLQNVDTVEEKLSFLHNRKICMLYSVKNDGGYVELTPRVGEPTKVPLRNNLLVVFRNDEMGYSYQPASPDSADASSEGAAGVSIAIQAWLTTEPQSIRLIELAQPPRPENVHLHVMSAMERFPIGCYGTDKVWSMFMGGTDGQAPIPFTRFDKDDYIEDSDDAASRGKGYTWHGALLTNNHLLMFDNKRFGVTETESFNMGPQQRWCVETGYEALYKAGYTMSTLNNQYIGTFTGDYMQDWMDFINLNERYGGLNITPTAAAINSSDTFSMTAGRLAFTCGIKGPIVHCDTACSASMIGINAACNMMRRGDSNDQRKLTSSVCLGVVAAIHPMGWVGMCLGFMLSRQGRCFTFDQSANGFIRGEGCAAVNIKAGDPAFQGAFDESGRLSYVGGTASNQDGKSASLTAPSGPAQQETIRISIRAGCILPQELTIGDCHGTGTALGDPIEFGANKAVLGVKERTSPNVLVSSKAHLGHTEATAGICGFIKITMQLLYQTSTPNPHIRQLNSHIDCVGYPVYFGNEPTDNGVKEAFGGIFSFGFGGSNTRADVWARAMKGARKDQQIDMQRDGYEALRMIQTVAAEGFLPEKPKLKLTPSH